MTQKLLAAKKQFVTFWPCTICVHVYMCVPLCMRQREAANHTLQAGHMYLITSKTESTAASLAACSSGVGDRKLKKSISAIPNISAKV